MMLKKLLILFVALLLTNLMCGGSVFASAQTDKETRAAEKVRDKIAEIGTGLNAGVAVILRDETRVNGYVSQRSEDSFVVMDGTGKPRTIAYSTVKSVKRVRTGGLSKGLKIGAIAAGVTAALIIVAFFVQRTER